MSRGCGLDPLYWGPAAPGLSNGPATRESAVCPANLATHSTSLADTRFFASKVMWIPFPRGSQTRFRLQLRNIWSLLKYLIFDMSHDRLYISLLNVSISSFSQSNFVNITELKINVVLEFLRQHLIIQLRIKSNKKYAVWLFRDKSLTPHENITKSV